MDQQVKPVSRGKGVGRREMGHQKAPGKEGKEPVGVCWEGGAKARETQTFCFPDQTPRFSTTICFLSVLKFPVVASW